VDQLYFEEGYLVAGYYTIIRESELALTVTGSLSAAVSIADSTGYYIPDYIEVDYFVGGGALVDATGSWSSLFTQTAQVTRIQEVASSQSAAFTQSSLVGRQQSAVIDITSAFTPTLTVDAFKNHTAILEAAVTMTSAGAVNRSANVLLDHIADLNAMAAKTVDPISTMAATLTQTTSATATKPTSASLSSSSTLEINAGKLKTVDAQFISRSSVFVSRYFGTSRPRNVTGNFTSTSKFGSGSLTSGTTTFPNAAYDLKPKPNQNWVYESWIYPTQTTISQTGVLDTAGSLWLEIRANSNRTVQFQTYRNVSGTRTGVGGVTSSANSRSSNPMIEISCGTFTPRSRRA
jgi:hypothetical protein